MRDPLATSEDDVARVLVVEDERIVAQDLRDGLESMGYDVVATVTSGEDAVAQARLLQPDLVLMDIHLEGDLDGVQAADQIQRERETPVVYLTAHSDDITLRRAKSTRPAGYIVKPFKLAELRCAIEIALHRQEIDSRLRVRNRWLESTLRTISVVTPIHAEATAARASGSSNQVIAAFSGWQHDSACHEILQDIRTALGPDLPESLSHAVGQLQTATKTGSASAPPDRSTAAQDVEDVVRINSELEKRVVERTNQLQAANHELEAFSYSVAHDLRAPLRGIDGFSQSLIESHTENMTEEGVALLHRVRNATARMGQLIDDLLRLAMVANFDLHSDKTDLSRYVHSITSDLRAAEPARDVTLKIQDGVTVTADPNLMRIVLQNLLGNAWKFTSHTSHATIEFGSYECDGEQVCFIRDNGAGFDSDRARRLFGAFQRFHNASEFEGTGIGLAIVQRVINRHSGRIWAESRRGQGATFYFVV